MQVPARDFERVAAHGQRAARGRAQLRARARAQHVVRARRPRRRRASRRRSRRSRRRPGCPCYAFPKEREYFVELKLAALSDERADSTPAELDRALMRRDAGRAAAACRGPYHAVAEHARRRAGGRAGADRRDAGRRARSAASARCPTTTRLGYTANGMTVWDVDDDARRRARRSRSARSTACPTATAGRASCRCGATTCSRWCTAEPRPRSSAQVADDRARARRRRRAHDMLYSAPRILKKTGLRFALAPPTRRPMFRVTQYHAELGDADARSGRSAIRPARSSSGT